MAVRITVTIPDDLHQRLQIVKDALNVSRLCQEAIDNAVRIEELKRQESPSMNTLIERLKIEKQQHVAEWKEAGVEDGKKDALELSYEEFKGLEQNNSIDDEDLLGWIDDRHLQYTENPDREAYLDGWLQGVLSVWNEVKNSL